MLTLCIPTLNRSAFIERLLRYYASLRVPYWIFIGDSSNPEEAARNQRTVAALQGTLKIRYEAAPGVSACACLERMSYAATTPYCVFLGDDDFLCPTALDRCVAFLEEHPEYGAAHGTGLMFQTEANQPHNAIGNVGYYPQAVVEAETGVGRLKEFFTTSMYTLLYSVHRTPAWQAMFRGIQLMSGTRNSNMFKDELIAVGVSVIRGKIRQLPALSLVHQVHEDSYHFPHAYDWLTDPAWFPSYQIFHARLAEELIRQDGVGTDEARAAIRGVFWPYLAAQIIGSWERDTAEQGRTDRVSLRQVLRRLPVVRRAWRAVRAAVQRTRDPWSLPALLHPTSAHHADFLPIYQIVTSRPATHLSGEQPPANAMTESLTGEH